MQRVRMLEVSEALQDELDRLVPLIGGKDANAIDNLRRSAESISFNMGEAVVAWKPKVKISKYEICRCEANEVRTILRLLVRRGALTQQQTQRAYNLTGLLIKMLVNASKSLEDLDR